MYSWRQGKGDKEERNIFFFLPLSSTPSLSVTCHLSPVTCHNISTHQPIYLFP
ncbi:hypothetical protein B6N60_02914 [Richelia sinica FACHB-800]|uniref:Uncharacterized protein n=1 Tax=Richelia sinica FACHB-800 TaxID=1357546 RepID=A0A975Y5G2_9NOST|nr:hypothetical protein B6N60_02914 [Richelia sinica FACHB-800]